MTLFYDSGKPSFPSSSDPQLNIQFYFVITITWFLPHEKSFTFYGTPGFLLKILIYAGSFYIVTKPNPNYPYSPLPKPQRFL